MTAPFPSMRRRHRRHPNIRNYRGLPAKSISIEGASRRLGQVLHRVRHNGICVVTQAGAPVAIVIGAEDTALTASIFAAMAVAAARRRNPSGVFTLADEVFESPAGVDRWMARKNWSLASMRPVDKLTTSAGVEEIVFLLHRIEHGIYG